MSSNENIKVYRVGEKELPGLLSLLYWRGTGTKGCKENNDEVLNNDEYLEVIKALESGYFWMFLAEYNGEPVGYITISKVVKPDSRKGYLFIDELWVPQPFRGLGLAKLLIEEVFHLTEELGMWKTRLVVGADNIPARTLYKKVGFVEDEAYFCQR